MVAKLKEQDEIFFTSKGFDDQTAGLVRHAFFGRYGGVSNGVYNALNMGRGSDDDPSAVKQNYNIISDILGIEASNVLTVHQIHSDQCVMVEDIWSDTQRPKADAMVSDQAGIALGVLTADCAPVLFHAKKHDGAPVIGAAHAGWKGAIGGILEATLETMKSLDIQTDSVQAVIGPSITQSSYEVDGGFFEAFCKDDESNERFFKNARNEGHYMFDLAGYCAKRLAVAGIKNVYIKDIDTYFNEEDFFSYRRATHRAEKDYGRQISVIMIK